MPTSETVTLLRGLDRQVKNLDHQVKNLDLQVKNIDHRVEGIDHRVENLDHRVETIEQILPTLATKDDLREGLREEGERSRRYMTMIAEDLRDMVNRALDGHMGHTQRLEEHGGRLDAHDGMIGGLDVRVTAIERPSRRNR